MQEDIWMKPKTGIILNTLGLMVAFIPSLEAVSPTGTGANEAIKFLLPAGLIFSVAGLTQAFLTSYSKAEKEVCALNETMTNVISTISGAETRFDQRLKEIWVEYDRSQTIFAVDFPQTQLLEYVKSAIEVKNIFTFKNEVSPELDVTSVYNSFFDGNPEKQWIDLIGPRHISVERYRKVNPNRGILTVKVLKHNAPALNFIQLTMKDGRKMTLFGWSGNSTKIFGTHDPNLNDFFEAYFEDVETYRWSSDHEFRISRRTENLTQVFDSPVIPKDGWWVTRYEPKPQTPENNRMWGLLKFDFINEGQHVFVALFDENKNFLLAKFHDHGASYGANEIYFRWEHPHNRDNGCVNYKFEQGTGRHHEINGFAVSEKTGNFGTLSGERLDGELLILADEFRDNFISSSKKFWDTSEHKFAVTAESILTRALHERKNLES